MAISGYLELRLMVMTSLTMSWRVVALVRTPGGNMQLFPSFFLSFFYSLSLSHFFSSLTSDFIIFLLQEGKPMWRWVFIGK